MSESKTVSTGIQELDRALGGGFLSNSVPLIIGGTYSTAWALGFEIFKKMMERGFFGIIINYYGPMSLLERHASVLGMDIGELGRRGDLAVIDVFGSLHGIDYEEPYVFSIGSVDAGTYLIKTSNVYYEILRQCASDRMPVGIIFTMGGFAHVFGEDATLKILQKNLAMKEKSGRSRGEGPITISLLHRDMISSYLLSWIVNYSEHVIELRPTARVGVEEIIFRKSLLRDFEPVSGELRFRRGRIELKIERQD